MFTKDAGEDGIEVRVQNHDVWLTQKAIAQLFDVERSVVTKHLKNIFESKELNESAVIVKADVSVAKNYLSVDEMQELNEIVTMYLDYATRQARRHIPITEYISFKILLYLTLEKAFLVKRCEMSTIL